MYFVTLVTYTVGLIINWVTQMRTLIIADKLTSDTLKRLALQEGHVTEVTSNGEEGEYLALHNDYDLIVIAITPPGIDGIGICKTLRARGIDTPVLVLAEKGHENEGIEALNAGADEYVCKPIAFRDLFARARAILRRSAPSRLPWLRRGDLELDPVTKQVWRGLRQIQLTKHEFALLEYMMRNPGKVMSRTALEEHVWGAESEAESNVKDVYIERLRRKIGDKDGKVIQTVRGFGYRLKAE